MFKDVLSKIQSRVEGTLAISLIGIDGIAIDSINNAEVPLENLGAEFGSLIKSIRSSNTELNAGEFEQLSVVTEKYTTFLSAVTGDYFILLVLSPEGNYGRARFELRKAGHDLKDELA